MKLSTLRKGALKKALTKKPRNVRTREQECWMPWSAKGKRFVPLIFKNRTDCKQWIDGTWEPKEYVRLRVLIKELKWD